MGYKKIGKSKTSCPTCGLSNSTMYKKGINYNTHRGQIYCQKHFLLRIETEEIAAKLKRTIERLEEMKEIVRKI